MPKFSVQHTAMLIMGITLTIVGTYFVVMLAQAVKQTLAGILVIGGA